MGDMGASSSRSGETLVHLPQVERLSPRVLRVLGCNPGEFELQGTNTYLVGTGKEVLLVDTSDSGNWKYQHLLKATLEEYGVSVVAVVITHWHRDHIGGAKGIFANSFPTPLTLPLSKIKRVRGTDDPGFAPAGFDFVDNGHRFKVEGATLRPWDPEDMLLLLLAVLAVARSQGPSLTELHFRQHPGLSVQTSPFGPATPPPNDPNSVLERIQVALGLQPADSDRLPTFRTPQPPTQPPLGRPFAGPDEVGLWERAKVGRNAVDAVVDSGSGFVKSSDRDNIHSPKDTAFKIAVNPQILGVSNDGRFDYDGQFDYDYSFSTTSTVAPIWNPRLSLVHLNNNPRLLKPFGNVRPVAIGANPKVVNLGLVPQLLSPTLLHNIVGIGLNPSVLDLQIRPQVLSPTIRTRILSAAVSPQLLKENFQPEVLSPELFFDGANLVAAPRILSQEIRPCLLGPKIHMALLKAVFAPDVAVSDISPSLLCPSIFLQLLKATWSPRVAYHSLSPSQLSPLLDVSLLEF